MSQIAADLLTSPGRGPNEAEVLMQWMQENEAAWRTGETRDPRHRGILMSQRSV
jgi:hypothetical protein